MRKKLKIFTVALCSAAVSLNMAAPYLHAEISQDEIDYKGLPIVGDGTIDYFPDTTFQQYLSDVIDGDGDGYLSDEEIAQVTEINLNKDKTGNHTTAYVGITKVNGIEVFENLERFICQDLASEAGASATLSLKFKDPNHNTEKYKGVNAKLKYVNCNHSNVTELDLTGCTELEYFNCSDNEDLTTLDLSENTQLEYLYCSNTGLTAPDLSKNTELKVLDCSYKHTDDTTLANSTGVFNPTKNSALTTLSLDKNAKLEYLDCSGHTSLTTLTLPNDFSDTIYLKGNSLKYIDCHECGLTALDLTYGTLLQYLNCSGNDISPLDVSKNTKLEYLDCSGVVKKDASGNMVVSKVVTMPLTLGKDSALRTLNCSNNDGITNLNADESSIVYSTSLETLNCAGTKLKSLDLTKNTALETLICEEQLEQAGGSFADGTVSEIDNLKLNRLLYKKAGLSFNDIFGNMDTRDKIEIDYDVDRDGKSDDTNVDIYYTDNALDIINVVAKDIRKEARFKEGTVERTVTYTNLDGETADLAEPEKKGDYTLANCTHLYKDVNRYSVINGEPVIVYANGAAQNITNDDGTITKKNSKLLNVYTDIAASYKVNDSGRAATGKVVVGVTDTPNIPTVTNNRIDNLSTVATAKIKNGQVTVTAKNNDTNESTVYYLWIIDTGSNATYECCPINILVAPKKLEVRNAKDNAGDPSLKDATRMIGETLEVCVAGYADTAKANRTYDSTYSWSVPDSVKDCVDIERVEGTTDRFKIKALKVNNNRDTNVNITFKCDQNSKKIKFVFKVSAAPLESPAPTPTAPPAP